MKWKLFIKTTVAGPSVRRIDFKAPVSIVPRKKGDALKKEKSTERRADNLGALRRKVHDIITCNARKDFAPIFLTFTYAKNQENVNEAWQDWGVFIQKLKRRIGYKIEFVNVIEFQKRGAVHFHALFFNLPLCYEETERDTRFIADLWGHGFVDIEEVRKATSIASYVTKYLYKDVDDIRILGRKAYSVSRGLKRPVVLYNYDAMSEWSDVINKNPDSVISKLIDENGNSYYSVLVPTND